LITHIYIFIQIILGLVPQREYLSYDVLTKPIYGGLWGWERGGICPAKMSHMYNKNFAHVKKAAQRAGSYPQTIFLFSWAARENSLMIRPTSFNKEIF
jgi:hypothetical protein